MIESKNYQPKDLKIGILGGGQLGKMLFEESHHLDLQLEFMDSSNNSSVGKISSHFFVGNIQSYNDVYQFGSDKQIVTIEIEHVNTAALEDLEKNGVQVYPQSNILKMIQDKGLQKEFFIKNNFPTAPFLKYASKNEIYEATLNSNLHFPFVQKLCKGGYDGKGVAVIRSEKDLDKLLDGTSIVEQMADIEKELSVIAVRSTNGELKTYPSVGMEFHPTANLVEFLICPSGIDIELEEKIQSLAKKIAEKLNIVGLLAIEMFFNKDGSIWINEMAPRPHNSGHHTLNNGSVSQFENHLRALTGLPLGNTQGYTISLMMNILGEEDYSGAVIYEGFHEVLSMDGVYPYLYGKSETKPFRKMGHITILDISTENCIAKYHKIQSILKVKSQNI